MCGRFVGSCMRDCDVREVMSKLSYCELVEVFRMSIALLSVFLYITGGLLYIYI